MGFRKSVNLNVKVSEPEFFNRDVNFKNSVNLSRRCLI